MGNPTGGVVVAGGASIASGGNTVTITQGTMTAIINWQQFSIAGGELTKFIAPSSSSATLNRVLGGNPSAIYGTLEANDRIFLINPNGIVVGPGGRIDTASFLGSTLDISDDEFLKGDNLHFSGTGGAIDNEGVIHASSGDVYLIATQVTNGGKLIAPHGNVGLAAGTDVLFQQAGDQHLFVQASNSSTPRALGVTNSGTIRAATAELKAAGGNAYALAINNTGAIAATGYLKVNGQVYLTSDGGDISNSGKISAKDPNGNGGTIVLNGYGTASSGKVLNSGKLIASGKAKGTTGGTVEVLGNQVGIMDNGLVDVSGDAGGGTALIGGDEHGTNPAIPDADQTYLGPDATITAAALTLGNGGKVILWGNSTTQAYGQISVAGGAQGGNGGFVETSAHSLDVQMTPNISAPEGTAGTWLLDPYDLTISNSATSGIGATSPFTESSDPANLNVGDLQTALDGTGATVLINTQNGSGGTGNITWESGTTLSTNGITNGTLTLTGPGEILFNGATITGTGSLNLELNSTVSATSSSTFGNVVIQNSTLNLGGGNLWVVGTGQVDSTDNTYVDAVNINTNSVLNAAGGNVFISGQVFNTAPSVTGGYFGVFVEDSTVETSGSGTLAVTGSVGTANGPLSANTQLEGVGLNFFNADVSTNVLSTVNGALTVNGTVYGTVTQGATPSSSGYGVVGVGVSDNTQVETTGTGSIGITGDTSEATTTDQNSGVSIQNGGTVSTTGASTGITITGTGGTISGTPSGGSDSETTGISMQNGSSVGAVGTTPVTLMGTGGTDDNINPIFSADSIGVEINAGQIDGALNEVSTASGTLTITGIGGVSPNQSTGVHLGNGTNDIETNEVSSGSGNINITGSVVNGPSVATNGNFDELEGVILNTTSEVFTNTGTITIKGTVNESSGVAQTAMGVIIQDALIEGQQSGGSISITGDTSGTTLNSTGVSSNDIAFGVLIGFGGAGGGGGGGGSIDTTQISVVDGNSTQGISITGYGGTLVNPGSAAHIPGADGIVLGEGVTVTAGGAAPLTLTGFGGQDNLTAESVGSASDGIFLDTDINGATSTVSSTTGTLSLLGTAGDSLTAATGVELFADNGGVNSVSSTSGDIVITGSMPTTANTSAALVGVGVQGATTIDTVGGAIQIMGTVDAGSATGVSFTDGNGNPAIEGGYAIGVSATDGALIESTGNGSVSIYGDASGATASQVNDGVFMTGGQGDLQNSFSGSSVTTTEVTAAGGLGISITGLAGTVSGSSTGTDIQTPRADGIHLDNGVSILTNLTSNSAPITLTGTGGTDTNASLADGNAEGIQIDAFGNFDGSNNGNDGTTNDSVESSGGNILLTGFGGSSSRSVSGVEVDSDNGGLSDVESTSGNITINGSIPNQTASQVSSGNGGDTGVDINGDVASGSFSSVIASAGSINITGTVASGTANSEEAGVVIEDGSQVMAEGTGGTGATAEGDVTLIGDTTGSISQSLNGGVFFFGTGTLVSATGTTANAAGYTGLTIHGTSSEIDGTTGGTIDQDDNNMGGVHFEPTTIGIGIVNGATVTSVGSAPMTLNGTGGLNANTLDSGNNFVSATDGGTSASYGVAVFSPVAGQTSSIAAGGALSITGTAGSSPTTGVGVMIGGPDNVGAASVVSTNGGITITGTGGAGNTGDTGPVPNAGFAIFNPGKDTGTTTLNAEGGTLQITATAGTGGLTAVDGSFYFNSVDNESADFNFEGAVGSMTMTSLGGLIDLISTTQVGNAFFITPVGTSSTLTYSDTAGAPLSLMGGGYTVSEFNETTQWATSNVTSLTISDSSSFPANTTLGAITTGSLSINLYGTLAIDGPIDASGLVTVVDNANNITFGPNGSISDSGAGNNVIVAAGTDLASSRYIVNDSTVGGNSANAIQVSGGAQFYLYSADPTYDTLGNIAVSPSNVVFNASYPEVSPPAANQELFFVAAAGDTGPNSPIGATSPGTPTSPITPPPGGGGTTPIPPGATPQPIQVAPILPTTIVLQTTQDQPPPFSGTGNFGQTGSQGGGLANSSGNGGQVGSGDAVQLNNGEMNNVSNPAASGALDQALSFGVHNSLMEAMEAFGGFTDNDSDSGSSGDVTSNTDSDKHKEKIISGGDVVEIGGGGVKKIPLKDAPQPLQNALASGVMDGLPQGLGH